MSPDHEGPLVPGDLPRSPTGRIPQWVLDERLGRTAPAGVHRPPTSTTPRGPAADPVRERPRRGGRVPLVIVLAVVLATVAGGLRSSWAPVHSGEVQGGAGASYRFLGTQDDGTPVAFPSCRTIEYVVRRDHEPDGGAQVLAAAIDEVSRVTGLRFAEVGPDDSSAASSPFAPVEVLWQTPTQNPALAGDVAGQAGPVQVSAPGHPAVYVTGAVQLDGPQFGTLLGQRNGVAPARAVVLHELGHLVGLDHVDDPSQLMHPTANGLRGYAEGDLAGLAQLGRGPCAPWL